ncbi:hypothetical protein GTS_33630 [Gandjariella thermophila]|uniref:DUF6545 domain-containing protein n=1 Tax=Gandjariella thermophila TaxID=1931992 RepID=A0A4D4J9Q7_9PSEU|nr:hypothetical protein GTS_33630 [Gandjariella thermophila]
MPRLVRAPHDLATRAVTACLAFAAVGLGLQWAAADAAGHGSVAPGVLKLVQNLVQYIALWCLMLFFLFAGFGPAARGRARREILPLAAAAVALTAAMFATPPGLRDHTFASADMRVPGVAAFYGLGGLYFLYVLVQTGRWAWQYADESDPRMRWGLRTASVGLGVSALASAVRVGFVVVRFAGGAVPASATGAAALALVLGGLLFMLGVIYPAVLTRAAAIRAWSDHRRVYRELAPLWELFHEVYPQDALHGPYGPRRDRFALWRVHRRFWRRVVEIRDGLVQLSPHLADVAFSAEEPRQEQIRKLTEAVRRQRSGVRPTSSAAVLVAAPATAAPEADVEQLLALSRALQARQLQDGAS